MKDLKIEIQDGDATITIGMMGCEVKGYEDHILFIANLEIFQQHPKRISEYIQEEQIKAIHEWTGRWLESRKV